MLMRIFFHDRNVTIAKAVEFVMDGFLHKICARKEIILSAGAFESPRLLMLSGIGPRQHLEENQVSPVMFMDEISETNTQPLIILLTPRQIQIDVVSDLPVGLNLQNHVAVFGVQAQINDTSLLEIPSLNDMNGLMQWYRKGTGPFTSPFGTHLGAGFFRMNQSDPEPDIEMMLSGMRDELPSCADGSVSTIRKSSKYSNSLLWTRFELNGSCQFSNRLFILSGSGPE